MRVVFEVVIEVARFTLSTASSFFIKLKWLMLNSEKAVWEDKGHPMASHQHLLSEVIDYSSSTETNVLHGFFFYYYLESRCYTFFCTFCSHPSETVLYEGGLEQ